MRKIKKLYSKCFCNETGKLTILQLPNLPGGLTFTFIALSWVFSTGVIHSTLRGSAAITGLWWAFLEVRYGVNYFRRGLGIFVAFVILRAVIGSL